MPIGKLYVKLDTDYYRDEKLIDAGEAAEVLFVRCLALAKDQLLDGYLSRKVVLAFIGLQDVEDRALALVNAGLWEETDGGWRIVSWLKHNPSAVDVEAMLERKRAAGRKGGKSKAAQRLKQSAKQGAKQSAKQSAWQDCSTLSQTETETEAYTEAQTEVQEQPSCPKPNNGSAPDPEKASKKERLQQLHQKYPQIAELLTTRWIAHAPLPTSSKTTSAKFAIADTIRKMHTVDGCPWEQIGQILEHAAREWVPHGYITSPGQLRAKKSPGDPMKHEKIAQQMKAAAAPPDPVKRPWEEDRPSTPSMSEVFGDDDN